MVGTGCSGSQSNFPPPFSPVNLNYVYFSECGEIRVRLLSVHEDKLWTYVKDREGRMVPQPRECIVR